MYKPPSLTLRYAPTTQVARAQWNRRVGRSQMRTDERVCYMGKTKEGDDAEFSMRAGDAGRGQAVRDSMRRTGSMRCTCSWRKRMRMAGPAACPHGRTRSVV